jgi:hypothetical protein
MKRRMVKNMTIAIFESGAKGFVPGKPINTLDCHYFDPISLSEFENKFIFGEKHYTRIDLISDAPYPVSIIYKRIGIIAPSGREKHNNYLTKAFYASGMDFAEVVKSMNRNGIGSLDLAIRMDKVLRASGMPQ